MPAPRTSERHRRPRDRRPRAIWVAALVLGLLGLTAVGTSPQVVTAQAAPRSFAVRATPVIATENPLHVTGTTTGTVSQLLSPVIDEMVGQFGRYHTVSAGTPVLGDAPSESLERTVPAGPVSGERCDSSPVNCETDPGRWEAAPGSLTTGGALARTTVTADGVAAQASVDSFVADLAVLSPELASVTGLGTLVQVDRAEIDVSGPAGSVAPSLSGVSVFGETVELTDGQIAGTVERTFDFATTDPEQVLASVVGASDAADYAAFITTASLEGQVTARLSQPRTGTDVVGDGSALRVELDVTWTVDIDSAALGTIDVVTTGRLLTVDLAEVAFDASGEATPDLTLQTVARPMVVDRFEIDASGDVVGGALAPILDPEIESTTIGDDGSVEHESLGTPAVDPGSLMMLVEEDEPVPGLWRDQIAVTNALDAEGASTNTSGFGLVVSAPALDDDGIAASLYGLDEVVRVGSLTSAAAAPRALGAPTSASLSVDGLEVLGQAVPTPGGQLSGPVTISDSFTNTDVEAIVRSLFGDSVFTQFPQLTGNLVGEANAEVTAMVEPVIETRGGRSAVAVQVTLSVEVDLEVEFVGPAAALLGTLTATGGGQIAVVTLGSSQAGRDGSLIEPAPPVPTDPTEPEDLWYVPTAAPSRLGLTVTEDPARSVGVTWRTSDEVESAVIEITRADDVEGAALRSIAADTTDPISIGWNYRSRSHSAIVDDLEPSTEYRYRVGAGETWSEWHTFTTAAADDSKLTFIGFGDAQNDLTARWTPVAQQAHAEVPEAVFSLHAGDMINNSDRDREWAEWFRAQEPHSSQVPMFVTPGNHEYSGDPTTLQYRTHYTLPENGPVADGAADPLTAAIERSIAAHLSELAYYVDVQGVRIVSLESNLPQAVSRMVPPDAPPCSTDPCPTAFDVYLDMQGEWLDRVLKENPGDWSVVTFHQPVFSTSAGRDNPMVRDAWVPILEENDVDLVLMGHDHSYARGHLAANETATPGITTGPVYAVSVSGPKYYDLAPAGDNVWTRNGAVQVSRASQTSGYQRIEIDGDTLHYRAVVAAKGPGSNVDAGVGETFDEFTVTKRADGQKWVTEPGVEIPGEAGPATISGLVLDDAGVPIVGARVGAFSPDDTWFPSALTHTGPDGRFEFADLAAGSYRVLVHAPDPTLVSTWIRGEAAAIRWFEVSAGAVIDSADVALARPYSLTGTVTNDAGSGVEGVVVRAYAPTDILVASAKAWTGVDGSYTIPGLAPGRYRIMFEPPAGSGLLRRWFDGAATISTATPVPLGPETESSADVVLPAA